MVKNMRTVSRGQSCQSMLTVCPIIEICRFNERFLYHINLENMHLIVT